MNKEAIHDEQIGPLVTQIIAICKEHKISMLCDFGLDEDLHCTTSLLSDDYLPSDGQLKALRALRASTEAYAMAETIETLPDGSKRISISRIA